LAVPVLLVPAFSACVTRTRSKAPSPLRYK
jgi:hypothetical protein